MYKLPEFYNILSHKNTLVIIDEVDSFLNASKCELLIQNKFINIDKNSIDLYLPIIFDYYYDDTKTEYADNVYDRLYNLLKICKYNYKINKDYGVINSFECALPFDYVGVPNSKNNFTDPLLTIITTAFAYYQKKEWVYDEVDFVLFNILDNNDILRILNVLKSSSKHVDFFIKDWSNNNSDINSQKIIYRLKKNKKVHSTLIKHIISLKLFNRKKECN